MRFLTKITSTVFIGLIAFVTLPSVSRAENNASRRVRILAFGDSLTAGYRLAPREAWPTQLESLLKAKGRSVEIVNAGVSGDTSAAGLRRVDWNLKAGPFDLVLIALGANDGLRQLPVSDFAKNLKAMITKFQGDKRKVALIGIRLPTNFSESYRRDFEAVYPKVARETSSPLYPFMLEGVALRDLLNLDDRIHPNAEGHKVIAQNLVKFVEPLLPK